MGRFLNVGIIQMPFSSDTAENMQYFSDRVDQLMSGYNKPELIVGVEGGIGYYTPQAVPGPITDYYGKIAAKYGVYLIPGTMYRTDPKLPEGRFYNSAPVFNPKGEVIAVYDKMAPWLPAEEFTEPGDHYVVFDIPEKDMKVGVTICYDSVFPEVSRNLALMGAEVIVKIAQDPYQLREIGKPIHKARAIENQCYYIATNGVGYSYNYTLYGESQIIDPEGNLVCELPAAVPAVNTAWLDLDKVKRIRSYGSLLVDHYIQHLGKYNFPMPFAGKISDAPIFKNIADPALNTAEYDKEMTEAGYYMQLKPVGEEADIEATIEAYSKSLDKFLERWK